MNSDFVRTTTVEITYNVPTAVGSLYQLRVSNRNNCGFKNIFIHIYIYQLEHFHGFKSSCAVLLSNNLNSLLLE